MNLSDGYEGYFGLAESPFTLTSNPRFLFESASYLAAFHEITYGLSRREPIIVITGPIGTGKTTLCRMIGERRGPRTVVTVIGSPPRTVDDLFRQILDGFGLLTDDTRRIIEASHFGLLKVLQQFLASLATLNAQAIVVFDEAQLLPPDLLEEIRLLLNLDADRQLLQIVLVGQPELDDVLARTELGQMQQRISRRHQLEPLQLAEVPAYVQRRLNAARVEQRAGDLPMFSDSAIGAIATLSHGVPRVVNILCDRSLENAWSDKTHTVDVSAVVRAARSLNIDAPPTLAAPVRPTSMPVTTPVASPPAAATPLPRRPMTHPTGGRPVNANVRIKRSYVPIAVAAALAVAALLAWMVRGGSNTGRTPATSVQPATPAPPAASRDAARSVPTDRPASAAPAPSVAPGTAPKPAVAASPAPPTAEKFLIVVSSFRTRDRASQVAADLVALGLPASVRSVPGWEQVVVGPYLSRQAAVAAQGSLTAAHFTDTNLTSATPPASRVP